MGELRSLAIGVRQRDPFVELIDVTGALGRSRRIVASPCFSEPFTEPVSGVHVAANHVTTVALVLEWIIYQIMGCSNWLKVFAITRAKRNHTCFRKFS